MDIVSLLNWRYATKRMNGEEISEEKLNRILKSIHLSASSIGIQPYKVLVIKDRDLRERIKELAYNQPQITESSHLLIFAAWDTITPERVEEYIDRIAEVRGVSKDSLAASRTYAENLLKNTAEQNFAWTSKQSYIALGTALIAAAAEQVDATPMEGFDAGALDDLLGLQKLGLRSVTLLPLGFRDSDNDWLEKLPKVRTDKSRFFITEEELGTKVA